jgi:hypothetical protein
MRHNVNRGCRACFCEQSDRGDIKYDITEHGRYHFDMLFLREEGRDLSGRESDSFFKNLGMKSEAPPITSIAPTLDLILGRGYDAPYSKWRGIGRILLGLLFNNILTKHGRDSFIKAFQDYPFPPGWPRI